MSLFYVEYTHRSRGRCRVWYETAEEAERAGCCVDLGTVAGRVYVGNQFVPRGKTSLVDWLNQQMGALTHGALECPRG